MTEKNGMDEPCLLDAIWKLMGKFVVSLPAISAYELSRSPLQSFQNSWEQAQHGEYKDIDEILAKYIDDEVQEKE